MDIRRPVAHLDPHGDVGLVQIDAQMGAQLQNRAAHLTGKLGGFHRKPLIAPFGFAAEGFRVLQKGRQVAFRGIEDGVEGFLAHGGAAKAGETEHVLHFVEHILDVVARVVVLGDHVHGALPVFDGKRPKRFGTAADLAQKHGFKGAAVRSLENQFAVFGKDHFIHCGHAPVV